MGKRFISLLIISILSLPILFTSAQDERDYEILSAGSEFLADSEEFQISLVLQNNGADADSLTDIVVMLEDVDEVIFTSELQPLSRDEILQLHIIIPINNFEPESQATLAISAGIDDVEQDGTSIAIDNRVILSLDVPEYEVDAPFFERTADGFIIQGEEISLVEFALGILASLGILMLFWIFAIFIRALFTRPPRFGAWQPPYGVMPMYDQNTLEGRRWGWQQVAQNGLLLAPPTPGNIHPVKLLMSADGINLDNWKVTGMRLSQYDVYGRIARTQVIAEKKWLNRMNKILKRRASSDEAKMQKMIRPITGAMVKQFTKKVNKKTAFLPIAFDIRWEGKHGDVRIIFELYQFSERAWYRIDQWDPLMQIVSRSMQENYTFTIHGKDNAEKMKDFRERLRDDLIWVLLESFRIEAVQEQITGQQPAVRQQYDVPDTLTGMDPIQPEDQPAPAQSDT